MLGLLKTRSRGFYTLYMHPCTLEAAFPADGAPATGPHRLLLPTQLLPSGMLSMDCRRGDTSGDAARRSGRMLGSGGAAGGGAWGKRVRPTNPLPCRAASAPRQPTLPELRWPAHYGAARTPFLRAAPAPAAAAAATGAAAGAAGGAAGGAARRAARGRAWWGLDVTGPANTSLEPGLELGLELLPSSAAEARRAAPPLLAHMAAAVAARSFNGKDLIP